MLGARAPGLALPISTKGPQMANSKDTITSEISSHVTRNGGSSSQWYFGIATDPKQRLFGDHAVKENGDTWIYIPCGTSEVARAIEKHFLAQGMQGGPGGGDGSSQYVYAYKITSHSVEKN